MAPWYIYIISFLIGAAAFLPAYFYTQWEIPILLIGLFLAGVPHAIKREEKLFNFGMGLIFGILGFVIAKATESLWTQLIN